MTGIETLAAVAGAVAGILAVVVALLAWLLPRAPRGASGPAPRPRSAPDVHRSPRLGFGLWQGDTRAGMFLLSDHDGSAVRVVLRPEPFEMRFPRLPAGAPLAVCVLDLA